MGLPAIALAVTALGTAVTVAGQIQQGQQANKAASAQAAYSSQVAENNAKSAELAARQAESDGVAKEADSIRQARARMGALTTAGAASGLDVNSGSVLDLAEGQTGLESLGFANVRDSTARQAAGYRTQGGNYVAAADMARVTGTNSQRNSTLAVTGTVLSGTSSAVGQYYSLKKNGADFNTDLSFGR